MKRRSRFGGKEACARRGERRQDALGTRLGSYNAAWTRGKKRLNGGTRRSERNRIFFLGKRSGVGLSDNNSAKTVR